jgi:hypothetical protein
MNASGNVITTLRDQLVLASQVDALIGIRSEDGFLAQARRIAESGEQVIPVILRRLPQADPRQLNALGVVASMYPRREEILNKLQEVAVDVERPDRERVSAMLILERFLDREPDARMVHTLDDPRAVAVESVRDLIGASKQEPGVLLQYTRALAEQPPDAIAGVVETMVEVAAEGAVPALSLMAQAENEAMSAAALHALGQIRHPGAARALQALLAMLPPARLAAAERSSRKLRFSGTSVEPLFPVDETWRALVSPIDGQGSRIVWFIRGAEAAQHRWFLGLVLHEDEGIAQGYGNYEVPAAALPERRDNGQLHRIPVQVASPLEERAREDADRNPAERNPADKNPNAFIYMLETDMDYARQLVQGAQGQHLALGTALPDAYRLMGPLIWQYELAQPVAPQPQTSDLGHAMRLLPETASLPYHPYFRNWFVGGGQVTEIARSLVRLEQFGEREAVRAWAIHLAQNYFDQRLLERMAHRLHDMSQWLRRAEEGQLAELAQAAAETIVRMPPAGHPFVLSMAELGLDVRMHSLL